MLDELQVKHVALINQASVHFSPGITVLTGESGAGKSAFLQALKLIRGERGDVRSIHPDAQELEVAARYFSDEEDCVATRRISKDGRSRAHINGSLASIKELAATVSPQLDFCSQHASQDLMNSRSHAHLFTSWIAEKSSRLQDVYTNAFVAWKDAQTDLAHIREEAQSDAAKLLESRMLLELVDQLDPSLEEFRELTSSLPLLEHGESLCQHALSAVRALQADGGALDALSQAVSDLGSVAAIDTSMHSQLESLQECLYLAEDAARSLGSYAHRVEYDEGRLDQVRSRLDAYHEALDTLSRRLVRTVSLEDMLSLADQARERLAYVDNSEALIKQARERCEQAFTKLDQAGQELTSLHVQEARHFSECVTQVMQRLEMGSASLVCLVSPLAHEQWTQNFPDSIEFFFKAGSQLEPRPLVRIASGGELSRVMLAIKVVLGATDASTTLVFDELDSGVGGSAAVALSQVLQELAQTHQLIVVTHLAQVAVVGDRHYRVYKTEDTPGKPESHIELLDQEGRVAELARMLTGKQTSDSFALARTLLDDATLS